MPALMLNTFWSRTWKEAGNNVHQSQQLPFSPRFQNWPLGKHIHKFTALWGLSKFFIVLVYVCVYMNLDHHINAACIHCMFILSYVEIILCGLNPQTWSWWLQGVCYCSLLLTCLAWFYVFTLLLAKTAASYFISQMFYFLWQFGRWNEYFLIVLIYTYLMNEVEYLLKYSQRVCLSTYLTNLFSFLFWKVDVLHE